MKILIIGGGGKIGAAVAWYLKAQDAVEKIGITDFKPESLERMMRWLNSQKLVTHHVDVMHREALREVMQHYDVGIITLPDRRASYRALEIAIEAGLNVVDILEEYHRRPDRYETEGLELPPGMSLDEYGEWLHTTAQEKGVTILDGMGFAPGLSNITIADGIRKMDYAQTAVARVGGIPERVAASKYPLQYMITWTFEHVLREYMIRVQILKDGEIAEVDAMSEREHFRFTEFGRNEELECAITPGMPSFIYTHPHVDNFAEKTIRWPGHWQGIELLKQCGLLDLTPLEYQEQQVIPRNFVSAVLSAKLQPQQDDIDQCVMWNTVTGISNGQPMRIDYYMWDEMDTQHNLSAMARVTGFSAAIGAILLGQGKIEGTGIVAPEEGIQGKIYDAFIAELRKVDVIIREVAVKN